MNTKYLTPAIVTLLLVCTGCSPASQPQDFGPVAMSSPAGSESTGPRLSSGPEESPILSWMEPDDIDVSFRYAKFENGRWGAAKTVVSGAALFVNWADLPSVVPVDKDRVVAHWLMQKPDTVYSYDIQVSQSTDDGNTWSDPITPHTDGTSTEHGFVSIFHSQDTAKLLWLDGRNMINEYTDDLAATSMTLRAASIGPGRDLHEEQLVDAMVCDCCQTDVAVAASGPVAVYRDRSNEEVRDISVARFVDGQWQDSRILADDNWEIAGCPVNGPSVVAYKDAVAVAWFTAANDTPSIKIKRSTNGGASFTEAIEAKSGKTLGRVGVAWIGDGDTAVSWLQSGNDGRAHVMVRRISADGILGPAITVSSTASPFSVPQMERFGNDLIFAWTETRDDAERIASAKVSVRTLDGD